MTDTDTGAATADRTRALIARMAPTQPESVRDDQRLIEDLGFDSIRLMELTVALERGFGLPRHTPQQLAGVLRVADVIVLTAAGDEAGRG